MSKKHKPVTKKYPLGMDKDSERVISEAAAEITKLRVRLVTCENPMQSLIVNDDVWSAITYVEDGLTGAELCELYQRIPDF